MIKKIALITLSILTSHVNCMEKEETPIERRARLLPAQMERKKKDKEFQDWYDAEIEKSIKLTPEGHKIRIQAIKEHTALIRSESLEQQVERFKELEPLFYMVSTNSSPQWERKVKERLELKPLKIFSLGENETISLEYIRQCSSDWLCLYYKCHKILHPNII